MATKKQSKILLIEDDIFVLSMYSMKFLSEGFAVRGARSGEEGLEEAAEFKPDLILLDIMLPDDDGISLLKKLKQAKATASIPVILLSNLSEPIYREQGLMYGAADYWIKAYFDPAEVVTKVQAFLE